MEDPLVSVILPTYKRPEKLKRAVDSALSQTYKNLEIFVINDDPETDITKTITSDKVICINNPRNLGAAESRNIAIRASNGDYIAFLDDDDSWLPNKIEKQVEKFKELDDDYGVIYTWEKIITNNRNGKERCPKKEGWIHEDILARNFMPSTSALVKKWCFSRAGMFDPEFQSSQDCDLWIRISNVCRFSLIPEMLTIRYIDGKDRINVNMEKRYSGSKMLLEKHFDEFQKNHEILGQRYKTVGLYAGCIGKNDLASSYLKKAVENKPDAVSIAYLFASKLPVLISKPIFMVLECLRNKYNPSNPLNILYSIL